MRKKEVQEASQQAQKSNDVKKAKEEALTRQIRLSLYNMDKDIRTVAGHNLSQNIYTASKNKSDKGWSATKELIDVVTDFVPGVGTIKDAYRLYQVLSNPKSNAKDVAEALVGFIPGLGDLKSISKVTNAIKKAFDIDPKKLDQAVSIIKGTGKASKYVDVTKSSSRYANRAADVSKAQFEENLLRDGWKKSISKDGKTIILEKDGSKYVLRDGAKSTGGSTADFYPKGSKRMTLKIRLK